MEASEPSITETAKTIAPHSKAEADPVVSSTPINPTAKWMWVRPWRITALAMGSGLAPQAPGTIGTLFGWFFYKTFFFGVSSSTLLIIITYSLVIGLWAVWLTNKDLGVVDHPAIVVDEVVAFWFVLWVIFPANSLILEAIAFVLFRYFDITKPAPIKSLEFKNPLGVMLDDLMAGVYTVIVLAILWRIAT